MNSSGKNQHRHRLNQQQYYRNTPDAEFEPPINEIDDEIDDKILHEDDWDTEVDDKIDDAELDQNNETRETSDGGADEKQPVIIADPGLSISDLR